MLVYLLIIRRHSRRSVPSPTASSLPHCPPLSLSSNSFPHNLLSDPHSLNPAVSIFYKNGGGRGPVRCLEQTCRRSNALLIHPLSFLHFTDTPTQRPSYNSFGINSLRTVFIATEGVPLPATISRKSGLGRSRRRNGSDRRAGAFLQRMNGIDRQVFKSFDQTAGPADLHPFDLAGGPEAKVDAHVAIGNVAGTAANFVDECARASFHSDLRADAVAIGFQPWSLRCKRLADGVERDPMVAVAQIVHQQHRRRVHVADHRGHAAVIPQIADGQSASRTYRRDSRPRIGGNIGERSVAVVVIEDLWLPEIAAKVLAVHFGINVAIDEQQIGPAVIIHVKKHDTPAEILRVQAESRGKSLVVKRAVPIVPVKRRGVVRKISLEKIEPAVAVVVRNGRSHASLLPPVIIKRGARNNGDIGERAVVIVVVEDAGGAVTGNIDVRPAVVIIVKRGNAEPVMPVGLIDVSFGGDVFEGAVAKIVVKNVFRPGQSARPAHDRNTFPHARRPLARRKSGGGIKIDVVGDE